MVPSVPFYIIIILAILLLVLLAERLKIAYPIILVMGGLLIAFLPGVPMVTINPALVFGIFLPPLLYEAAWYTSWKEFWKWRRVIFSFAFLIVLVTSLLVAWVTANIIPGFSLALGFLLGGIVSPPDAVSATAILKQIRVPRRVSSILEGESLLNDASSLVVFRFSLIAVSTGRFIFHEAAISFVWIIVAGILVGVVMGYIIFMVHRWLPTNVNSDIIITLLTPYILYVTAEATHVSGVLAVVSGGFFLASKRHQFLTYSSRLRGTNVWSVLGFLLNGLVFILIGLELPDIVNKLGGISLSSAIGYGVLITIVLMVSRVACALGASVFTRFISRFIRTADSRPGWKAPLVFGWAGMRGVVSLAAALSIPVYTANGDLFPQRNLILFITFMVILLTLVLQGLTLPVLIHHLKIEDPDHYLSLDDQEKLLRNKLARESIAFLENRYINEASDPSFQLLIAEFRQDLINENYRVHGDRFRYAYNALIREQRNWLWKWNMDIKYDDEVIRKLLLYLDMEEEKLNGLPS